MIVAATASTAALRRFPRVFVSFRKLCAVTVVPRSSEKSTGRPHSACSSAPKARAFLGALPLAAVHVARQADDDLLRAARFGDRRNPLEEPRAVVLVNDLHRAREHFAFVAHGDAGARLAEVHAENNHEITCPFRLLRPAAAGKPQLAGRRLKKRPPQGSRFRVLSLFQIVLVRVAAQLRRQVAQVVHPHDPYAGL